MISDGIEYERRCAMLQVEGDGEGIYGAHDCIAVVVAASTEKVELHHAKPQAVQWSPLAKASSMQ